MTTSDLTTLLRDRDLSWTERRTRLQGWRGADAADADAARGAQRIGAAGCAVGAFLGAAAESPLVLAAFAATALVGAFAPNHPFEWLYNRMAERRGAPLLPPNRAAKRLGCAVGTVLLGGAAIAFASGAAALGTVLALVLGCTAAFVAVTGICVPSVLFTALWGAECGAAPSLWTAIAMSEHR